MEKKKTEKEKKKTDIPKVELKPINDFINVGLLIKYLFNESVSLINVKLYISFGINNLSNCVIGFVKFRILIISLINYK